jgi:DNA-binding Lrp family transcriptional regulator
MPSVQQSLEVRTMVMAVVLINVRTEETSRIAQELSEIPGVSEVYSVAGNYDLVAMLRVKDNDSLAALVTDGLRKVAGITRTETLIGFRAYSKHDLDSLFSLD